MSAVPRIVAVEKRACDFAELQPVVRKEERARNAIDRQRLAQKNVIHPGWRIDRRFEMVVRRAGK